MQYTLTEAAASTVTFNGTAYRLYLTIPEFLTLKYAYHHAAAEYPPDLGPYAIHLPADGQINGGEPVTLSAPTASAVNPQETIRLVQSRDGYYLPYLPNSGENSASAEAHQGLTAHVYWLGDYYLKADVTNFAVPYHLAAYGWGITAEQVAQPFVIPPIGEDGGTPMAGLAPVPINPNNPAPMPFNAYQHLVDGTYGLLGPDGPTALINLLTRNTVLHQHYYLNHLAVPPAYTTTRAVAPTWLQAGAYLPVQPYPGFQPNLVRWYTPWQDGNLLTNTSGLLVRHHSGAVEIPLCQDDTPCPLVRQTWDGNQFAALNLTNSLIALVTTPVFADAAYLPANVLLPQQAGLLPYYYNYKLFTAASYSQNYMPVEQTYTAWLGFKGETLYNTGLVYPGPATAAVQQDPQGLANKPYQITTQKQRNGQTDLTVQHTPSLVLASQPHTLTPLYRLAYYAEQGQGYQLLATFSYSWQPWAINDQGQWVAATDGNGTYVPVFTLNDPAYAGNATTEHATALSPTRHLSYQARPYQPTDTNQLGGVVQAFQFHLPGHTGNTHYLLVLQNNQAVLTWPNPDVSATADPVTGNGQGLFNATAATSTGEPVSYHCTTSGEHDCTVQVNGSQGTLTLSHLTYAQDKEVIVTARDDTDPSVTKIATAPIHWNVIITPPATVNLWYPKGAIKPPLIGRLSLSDSQDNIPDAVITYHAQFIDTLTNKIVYEVATQTSPVQTTPFLYTGRTYKIVAWAEDQFGNKSPQTIKQVTIYCNTDEQAWQCEARA